MAMKKIYFFLFKIFNIFDSFNVLKVFLLKCYGLKIGKNVLIKKNLRINVQNPGNIILNDNILIRENVEFKIRDQGKIIIKKNVVLDDQTRLISANLGNLFIDENSEIGFGTILIAGGNLNIGKNCMVSNLVFISTSNHKIKKDISIKSQGYENFDIFVEDDVWIGRCATINSKLKIKKGSIIGANSLLNISTEQNGIYVGTPAKLIKERE
jgi:acetyltransferase-like isoleucine patch superfamily enzyme